MVLTITDVMIHKNDKKDEVDTDGDNEDGEIAVNITMRLRTVR